MIGNEVTEEDVSGPEVVIENTEKEVVKGTGIVIGTVIVNVKEIVIGNDITLKLTLEKDHVAGKGIVNVKGIVNIGKEAERKGKFENMQF